MKRNLLKKPAVKNAVQTDRQLFTPNSVKAPFIP